MLKLAWPLQCAIIIIIGAAIYAGTFNAPFNFDDEIYLVKNPAIKDFGFFLDSSRLDGITIDRDVKHNFILRPVAYLSFALNFSLHSLDVRGYHFVNLLLHIANALLVYRFLGLTLRTPYMVERLRTGIVSSFALLPLGGALLFVSHPLQTQAVTYIIQRFVPLGCFFFLGALVLYAQARFNESRPRSAVLLALSFVATLLAMNTKETSFTLPVVLMLYEFMFFQGEAKKRLLRLLPFLATMALIPWTVIELAQSAETASSSPLGDPTNLVNFSGVSRWDYLMTQFGVITTYLRLLFFPVGQSLDHDWSLAPHFLSLQVVLPLLVLLALFGTALHLWRLSASPDHANPWSRVVAFGIFWFFVTISVESSIVPLEDLLVEHRIYLPSVGFFTALLGVIALLVTKHALKLAQTVLAAVIALLSVLTIQRNILWTDNVAIWRDAVAKGGGKNRPYNNLGYWLNQAGRHEEAVAVLQKGLELHPDYVKMYMNLGVALSGLNRLDEAIAVNRTALERAPDNPRIANNLATLYLRQGMVPEGHALLLKALELNPKYGNAYYNLGCMMVQEARLDEAREALHMAERLSMDDTGLQLSIAEMLRHVESRMTSGAEAK